MKTLKLMPFLSERPWGGKKAKELNFDTNKDNIGEIWCISAHDNGMSKLIMEDNSKISLKDFFENNRDMFNNYKGQYPLLNKILLPEDYLSVQVHPNDEYAMKHHNSLGKPECWYVLDCDKNPTLVYGHNAKTKEEFMNLIKEGNWDKLLKKEIVEKNSFINVPVGKVHAVGPGLVIYEVQRSSDITYRLYDYNRKDKEGNLRDLHIQESIDNVLIPDSDDLILKNPSKDFFYSKSFNLYIINGSEEKFKEFKDAFWLQVTLISDEGVINDIKFNKYESAIIFDCNIPSIKCSENSKIIVSYMSKI